MAAAKKNEDKNNEVAEQQSSGDNASLSAENDVQFLQSKVSDLERQIKDREVIIEKLSAELRGYIEGSMSISSADKGSVAAVIPKNPVMINDVAYFFQKPAFIFSGVYYTSEEAALDSKLLSRIIEIPGQTILREQV